MTTTQLTDPIGIPFPDQGFDLTDLKASVGEYLRTQVITTVSTIEPSDPQQEVLTPGQKGTFTISATNGDEATGIRLLDVRFHVEVTNADVIGVLAPVGLAVVSSEDSSGNVQVPRNEHFPALFMQNIGVPNLEAGQTNSLTVQVQCLDQGVADVTVHVHADVDQDDLYPRSNSRNGEQPVEVL